MNRSLFVRTSSGVLAIAFLCAPGGASTVGLAPKVRGAGQRVPTAAASSQPFIGQRLIRTSAGIVPLLVPGGCSGFGSEAFTGGGSGNSAAGIATGIVSGANNEACDQNVFIGAGSSSVVGGNDQNLSYDSAIVAGGSNGIAQSAAAFIGGGVHNLISYPPNDAYPNGNLSAIGAGGGNTVAAPQSFIGAGVNNTILSPTSVVPNGPNSFIGAGYNNFVYADFAVIGGGYTNSNTGEYATINGGFNGSASGSYAVIAGGSNNKVTGSTAAIGGGYSNSATALYSAIPGGHGNIASGFGSVTAGGSNNTASGRQAAVPGGELNVAAGQNSFAAGTASDAATPGAFVWSDNASGATTLKSSVSNQFLARASGGFFLYSAANLKAGVELAPGSGAWSTLSDRNVKTGIEHIDETRILARLAAMPVSEWSYTAQGTDVRHLGPMAQDFRAAFGLGEDDRHISTVDEEGVALAAIKALNAEVAEKDREIAALRRSVENVRRSDQAQFAHLDQRLEKLEERQSSPTRNGF